MNNYFSTFSRFARNTLVRAEAVNAVVDAIIVGFDGVPDASLIQQDRVTHCTDTGTANAYVIAPTYAIVSYVAGQRYSFVSTHANTTASTVNVSGLGVKTIKRQDGTDLVSGDIASGQMVEVRYDGTYFQLMSMPSGSVAAAAASAAAAVVSAAAASTSAGAASTSATAAAASATAAAASVVAVTSTVSQWVAAGGTADAITGTFPVTVTSLTDGLILGFRAASANATTTPTFKADGTTARTITRSGGVALAIGDIRALGEYLIRYNLANTRWELLNVGGAVLPTGQVLTSGSSATYTTPAGVRQLRIRMVGGGGGGGGASTTTVAAGSAGGFTSFDNASANVKAVGGTASGGAAGAYGTTPGTGTASYRQLGSPGGGASGVSGLTGANTPLALPGAGGSSLLGGGANVTGTSTSAGASAATNSGGGGSGALNVAGANYWAGGGGQAGEYVEFIITAPLASYTYTIGAGGAGGVSTNNGGAGGSGVIIVDPIY